MNSLAQPGKWERYFWPLFAAAFFLVMWYVLVKWTASKVFPSPLDVQRGMAELVRKGVLWHYMMDSLGRVATGYLTAGAHGLPTGLVLGRHPAAGLVGRTTHPSMAP